MTCGAVCYFVSRGFVPIPFLCQLSKQRRFSFAYSEIAIPYFKRRTGRWTLCFVGEKDRFVKRKGVLRAHELHPL